MGRMLKKNVLIKIGAIAAIVGSLSAACFLITAPFSPILIVTGNWAIMQNLSSNETMTSLRDMFDREYNFTELYQWEHERVKFVGNESFERSSDPLRILQVGKGRCGEFSVLYAALCFAHGYQSRLVFAVDVTFRVYWFPQHEWVEVKVNDQWIHVDPSEQVWDDPSLYRNWSWAKGLGSNIRVYAFEDGKTSDVTEYYKTANL